MRQAAASSISASELALSTFPPARVVPRVICDLTGICRGWDAAFYFARYFRGEKLFSLAWPAAQEPSGQQSARGCIVHSWEVRDELLPKVVDVSIVATPDMHINHQE